ncbi:MAG: sugar ABC transporter permease [Bifidobacteriaceae bacterium]|jgi:multiple sugar transport system permease protein|nr:sugar ABC transporter permease [Bifidobacteriaceae bacterium]
MGPGRGAHSRWSDTPTWPFISPLIVVLAFATVFPLLNAVYLSFFNWNWGKAFSFIGFDNYAAVTHNADYWAALGRTVLFTVMAVATELVIGFALALAAERTGRHIGWVRTVLIIPLMVSGIVVSLIWKVMLDPTIGVIPWALGHLGIDQVNLLGESSLALPTIAGIDTWWQTGFVFIILNAGLQALPHDPFEAAAVDGANAFQRLRYLTIPMMTPVILVVAGIRAIDCLKLFALVFGATGGGPGQATEATQILAYRTAFKANQMSMSMTMMVVYAAMIVALAGLVLTIRRIRRNHG